MGYLLYFNRWLMDECEAPRRKDVMGVNDKQEWSPWRRWDEYSGRHPVHTHIACDLRCFWKGPCLQSVAPRLC